MVTAHYSWNDDVAGSIDIAAQYNTTLDAVDSQIKTVRDGYDRKYSMYTLDNNEVIFDAAVRTDLNNPWLLSTDRGVDGTVTMVSNGIWNLSAGVWYIEYNLYLSSGALDTTSGVVESYLRNTTKTFDIKQGYFIKYHAFSADMDKLNAQKNFYLVSRAGGDGIDEVEPTDNLSLQILQDNSSSRSLTLRGNFSSWIKFLFVTPLEDF